MSGVIYALESVLDDEGRPLGERRAPSAAKQGVDMDLRACPYHDERKGHPMNVAALAQITRHLTAVSEDIADVRSWIRREERSWIPMFVAVIDQLSAPARHLLERRSAEGPIPAILSVGHKLAAGYLGVVRDLVAEEALGGARPIDVDSFMAYVHSSRALIGAAEACAGPPHMIERLSGILLDADPGRDAPIDARRLEIATRIATQIRLGIVWERYDLAIERHFFEARMDAGWLRPRNDFMREQLESRRLAARGATLPPIERLPDALPDASELARPAELRAALEGGARRHASLETVGEIARLIGHDEGALPLNAEADPIALARDVASYLWVYRAFVGELWSQERRLRVLLEYDTSVPLRCTGTILPLPRALRWFEALTGHRLDCQPGDRFELALRSHRRRALLFPADASAGAIGSANLNTSPK
ncbi:MAG: hypothetical protein OEY14_04835 [Myxococcales bacterium]|nr:hypothetical protein [Myxococcales bacterium]